MPHTPPPQSYLEQEQEQLDKWLFVNVVVTAEDTRPPIFNKANVSAGNSGCNVNGPGDHPDSAVGGLSESAQSSTLSRVCMGMGKVSQQVISRIQPRKVNVAELGADLSTMVVVAQAPASSFADPQPIPTSHITGEGASRASLDENIETMELSLASQHSVAESASYSLNRYIGSQGRNQSYHLPLQLESPMMLTRTASSISILEPFIFGQEVCHFSLNMSGDLVGIGQQFGMDETPLDNYPLELEVSAVEDEK